MTYYKILENNKAVNGGNFDYTDYLPKHKRSGEWTPLIQQKKLVECLNGYHVTKYWNMWYANGCDIFEVDIKNVLINKKIGVNDKVVCGSIRFIKEIKFKFDKDQNTGYRNTGYLNTGDQNTGYRNTGYLNTGNINTGDRNTGYWNTGNRNTGDRNTGYLNTGDRNTGNINTGDRNTGYLNTGDRNTGNRNTGDQNTGYRNTGYLNTGDRNTGYLNTGDRNTGNLNIGNLNTGDRNTGYWNTGNLNTGDRNTGYWNTGNYNTGSLNTISPKYVMLFNKSILYIDYIKICFPNWFYFDMIIHDNNLHKSWYMSFENATKIDIQNTISLPNFDYNVFENITGITKKMINKKLEG